MNITKRNSMKRLFTMILLSMIMLSCDNNTLLYDIIVYNPKCVNNYYNQSPIIVPVYNKKDSVYYCTTPRSFYTQIGVFINTEQEFTQKLYNRIIANDFIRVSDSVFSKIKKRNEVIVKNEYIFNVYNKDGILFVLEKYTNRYGEIDYDNLSIDEINYIYYLAFKNNIYFYWSDEGGPGYFLDDDILKQLNKSETKIY